MLKWLGGRSRADDPEPEEVTDDPLAIIDGNKRQIYSVSRSVLLPRVTLRTGSGGVNPLFNENLDCTTLPHKPTPSKHPPLQPPLKPPRQKCAKSGSSGYGSHGETSSHEPIYTEAMNPNLPEDSSLNSLTVLEQNANYVRSILVANGKGKSKGNRRSVHSSGSSGAGTLSTIPEGKVDFSIPRPIWPKYDAGPCDGDLRKGLKDDSAYDSLVDEALLLYTSLNASSHEMSGTQTTDLSIRDVLIDLSNTISATVEGKTNLTPEEVLKTINDTIQQSLEVLHSNSSSDEDVRKLCVNLSNNERVNSVVRAFSNNSLRSSSGHSSQSSPSWASGRVRTISSDEEIYHSPSGSSSSGFSEAATPVGKLQNPVFVHDDIASVRNGVRNAMIYGTLCRSSGKIAANACSSERLIQPPKGEIAPKKSLLAAPPDSKPSVWELYYGVNVTEGLDINYNPKPSDTPLFPAGRPEADFTLDVPRSELLSRKMKQDKKWRCRCRLLTSFLGLVFFLLSVMAVSLMLTRGKRMFGSMV